MMKTKTVMLKYGIMFLANLILNLVYHAKNIKNYLIKISILEQG